MKRVLLIFLFSLNYNNLYALNSHTDDYKPTVLITGSTKGHGLAFVKDYAERGWNVIATCRSPDSAYRLNAFAELNVNVTVEKLDLTDFTGIKLLAKKYYDQPIDVLNLNGAINTFRSSPNKFGNINYKWFEEIMRVNVIGQLYTAEIFLENVLKSKMKKIAVMSATGGSISDVKSPIAPSYKSSKAALNMIMRTFGEEVKSRGGIVLIIAPGTIDAEDYMNPNNIKVIPNQFKRMIKMGYLIPRSAIQNIIDLINTLTIKDIYHFHKWDGTKLNW